MERETIIQKHAAEKKKRRGKTIKGVALFLIAFISIQVLNCFQSDIFKELNINDIWSKEVEVGEFSGNGGIDILQIDDKVYVINTYNEKEVLTLISSKGEVIKKVEVELGEFPNGLFLLNKDDEAYLSWTSYQNGSRCPKIARVTPELELTDLKEYKGYENIAKIDDENLILYKEGNFKVFNTYKGVIVEDSALNGELSNNIAVDFAGDRVDDTYYISYYSFDSNAFVLRTYNKGEFLEEKEIKRVVLSANDKITREIINISDEEINLVYERLNREGGPQKNVITYSLVDGKVSERELEVDGIKIENYSKMDDGSFLGSIYHIVDNRYYYENVVRFNIVNGSADEYQVVSSTKVSSTEAVGNGDYVVFKDGKKSGRINIVAYDKTLKEVAKKTFNENTIDLVMGVIGFTLVTFMVIFAVGIVMFFGPAALGGLFILLDGKINGKRRKIVMGVMGVFTILWQARFLRLWFVRINGLQVDATVPWYLSFAAMIVIICISVIINLGLEYKNYINRGDKIVWVGFILRSAIQISLLAALFAPFSGIR